MNNIDDRTLIISKFWSHHAHHSGYGLLGKYVGKAINTKPIPDYIIPDQLLQRLNSPMAGYDRTSIALEVRSAQHMAMHNNCLYHILAAETCYGYLGRLNGWRGHKIIATYHHPPSTFAHRIRNEDSFKQSLESLAGIIIVGRNQHHCFNKIIPDERIFFAPHPVDTTFYTPPTNISQRETNLCLFVGSHLRDFSSLRSIIEDAYIVFPRLHFAIITRPEEHREFEHVIGNYKLYGNISDEALLEFYQRATILIQPLQDATANNAILEGMACGLPMVITDVGAVHDYVTEEFAYLTPAFDSQAMLSAIAELTEDHQRREKMALKARQHSLLFDWKPQVQHMREIYSKILA